MSNQRKGVKFEVDYPFFERGISYMWPNNSKEFNQLFFNKRDELAPILNERFRRYVTDFLPRQKLPSQCVSKGRKGLTIGFYNGGKWIEFWDMGFNYFVAGHNLDSWVDNAIAFNLASDVLEELSLEILAPRVKKVEDQWSLRYPLPEGMNKIKHKYFTPSRLEEIYANVDLHPGVQIEEQEQAQIVSNPQGKIIIRNGFCETQGFKSWDVAKSSYVVSRLLCLTDPKF